MIKLVGNLMYLIVKYSDFNEIRVWLYFLPHNCNLEIISRDTKFNSLNGYKVVITEPYLATVHEPNRWPSCVNFSLNFQLHALFNLLINTNLLKTQNK